jgi:hypothetical protein
MKSPKSVTLIPLSRRWGPKHPPTEVVPDCTDRMSDNGALHQDFDYEIIIPGYLQAAGDISVTTAGEPFSPTRTRLSREMRFAVEDDKKDRLSELYHLLVDQRTRVSNVEFPKCQPIG